jgi:hypothetical protein
MSSISCFVSKFKSTNSSNVKGFSEATFLKILSKKFIGIFADDRPFSERDLLKYIFPSYNPKGIFSAWARGDPFASFWRFWALWARFWALNGEGVGGLGLGANGRALCAPSRLLDA